MSGIIGPVSDPQVACVASALRRRGAAPVVLDLGQFPHTLRLSLRDGIPSADGVDLLAVSSWYVRSLPLPLPFRVTPAADTRVQQRNYAAGRERRSFVAGFVAALAATGSALVNPPERMAQHFRKCEQLDALRAAGVPVPATLATNDPDAVVTFAGEVGALVYKPLAGGGRCRRLTDADLSAERLSRLAAAPVLFQAEVPGTNPPRVRGRRCRRRGLPDRVRRAGLSRCWSATPRRCSPASSAVPVQSRCRMFLRSCCSEPPGIGDRGYGFAAVHAGGACASTYFSHFARHRMESTVGPLVKMRGERRRR
jgi:hypothetical protein